jgi:peptidoglycan/LPS O-acetylase OafA/YrhL
MESPAVLLLTGLVAFIVCVVLALISYHYFEKRFLKLKDKFAFIVKK